MANTKAAHHRGKHQTLARQCVQIANATPNYTCPRCGLTRQQGTHAYGTNGSKWDAGHKTPGRIAQTLDDYQAEHAHCNRSAGATQRNQRKRTSRNW